MAELTRLRGQRTPEGPTRAYPVPVTREAEREGRVHRSYVIRLAGGVFGSLFDVFQRMSMLDIIYFKRLTC